MWLCKEAKHVYLRLCLDLKSASEVLTSLSCLRVEIKQYGAIIFFFPPLWGRDLRGSLVPWFSNFMDSGLGSLLQIQISGPLSSESDSVSLCWGPRICIYLFIYLFKFLSLYSFFFHFSCFIFYAITDVSFSPFTPLHPAHLHFYSQSPPHCPRVHHVCSVTDLFPFFQSVAIIPPSSYSCQSIA